MRTNIVIDDQLMAQAREMTGLQTKKDVVDHALRLLIRLEHQARLREVRGKVRWTASETGAADPSAKPTPAASDATPS